MFYILPPAPAHGMYPGVISYGMEADPPRFLYLKDEYFLMTDWRDIDISLIMKNSKSVTLTSKSVRMWVGAGGGGMEQCKALDQYQTSGIVVKFHKVRDLYLKVTERVGMVQHYILDQYLIPGKVSTRSS